MEIPVSLLLCITAAYFSALYDTASASGVCSVSGGGHYYTFDGVKFDYQGVCEVSFAFDYVGDSGIDVNVGLENRFGNRNVSFVSYVWVTFANSDANADQMYIRIGHYPNPSDPVTVQLQSDSDDVAHVVPLPHTETDFSITNVNETCDGGILLDFPSYEVQIRYNEWSVTLIVSDNYRSNMGGICGNFDDDPMNDLYNNGFDANDYPNPGKMWGDHWVMHGSCSAATPTPDKVPTCTDNSYACNTACDYLADSTGIYSSAVQAMGATLAEYYKQDCQFDACVTKGQSLRNSVRQFLTVARFKNSGCTGCKTSIAGFPLDYARVSCNNAKCQCGTSPKSCQLHVPMCGFWCDCIGLNSGYGTLYECWRQEIPDRCFLVGGGDDDSCTSLSLTEGNNPFPYSRR